MDWFKFSYFLKKSALLLELIFSLLENPSDLITYFLNDYHILQFLNKILPPTEFRFIPLCSYFTILCSW